MSNINFNAGSNHNNYPVNKKTTNEGSQVNSEPRVSNEGKEHSAQKPIVQTSEALTNRINSNLLLMKALDPKDLSRLLKELLSLPRDLKELLAMLAFGHNSSKNTSQILKDINITILLKDIQNLLSNNTKEALNKLLLLTQNNALFFEGKNELRSIMSLLQEISKSMQQSPSDTLHNVLLLYLPWIPLAEQQKFDIFFGHNSEESKSSSTDEEILVIFVTTNNIGNFKITIILTSNNIEIFIENNSLATDIIDSIKQTIKDNLNNPNITLTIESQTIESKELEQNPYEAETSKKKISLHPSGSISPITIHTGFIIIKTIFEFDEKKELRKKREEKIK